MKEMDDDVGLIAPQFDRLLSLVGADSLELIFQGLVHCTIEWIRAAGCGLWWLDKDRNGFRLSARSGAELGNLEDNLTFLPYDIGEALGLLSGDEPVEIAANVGNHPHIHFGGCLTARIHYDDRTTGLLVAFPRKTPYSWAESERKILGEISRRAALLCRNVEHLEKLTRLVDFLQEMSEANADYELYDLVLREGRFLFGCDRAVVRRVNLQSGHLDYVRSRPKAPASFALGPGEGITGRALSEHRTYRIEDVTAREWADVYRPLWPNLPQAHSELAVPVLLRKTRVRKGTGLEFLDKSFGVLNFESPTKGKFSSLDQYCGEVIAQRMAPALERIEFDKKLERLRHAEQSLAKKRDWDAIVDTLLAAIRDALGYEFVSMSLVDADARVIRCTRVIGTSDPDGFRKSAVHDLESQNVQADVVRKQQTEVPAPDDPRLSPDLALKFGLDKLIRVFVPMTVPSRRDVIGTISAGYDRRYREHIYERDVQLLKGLVNLGSNAMESWRRGTTDRISHEMNAPLTAVRGNVSRLRQRRRYLSDNQIELALEDMETDTEVLHHQVQQLEYVLGGSVGEGSKQPLHTEPVLLFRDIIFKTINQLKPLVKERGLDPKKISYDVDNVYRVKELDLDKSKISQVIFNLFMNAIKYAESPETFQIEIGAEEAGDHYVIKFCDWGIGIPAGLEDRIFEERFRAPAVRDSVIGSGLGLTIARQLMQEHGGDLVLKNRHKPTEFQLIIPKQI